VIISNEMTLYMFASDNYCSSTSFAASDPEASVVLLFMTSKLDTFLSMGIPRSLRLERSLSLEEGDMVSVREDGDE
jgi:hypothetical protein